MAVRFIAWRFLLKGTERGTFSPMTLFAWLAIGVGVGAMSSLLSVMYGFEGALKDKVLNAYPHILINSGDGKVIPGTSISIEPALRAVPGVKKVIPYVQNEMILKAEKRSVGAVVWGIPTSEMVQLHFKVKEGQWPVLNEDSPQMVVGSELAERMGLSVGDAVQLISPLERGGALGLIPQSQVFSISGFFSSGHYDFDEQYLIMPLEDAQELLGLDQSLSGWQVWTHSVDAAEAVASKMQELVPRELEVKSWKTFNSALFQSLQLEQYSMFLILSFSILIAVMNVVITLTMNVAHKKKNIGILRALGATQKQINRIFLWEGAFMGAVGLSLGALLTLLFVLYVKYFSFYQLPEIYYDRTIPVEIRPLSLLTIYGVATVLIALATLYPASRAAQLNTIEAIRES
ncbi:FtsX-like permease family protein [bacterium]|nr:FtsX-like permease family protein [bacterium]